MINQELLKCLKDAREELRLIRMKDTNAVYDPTLRIRMDLTILEAEFQLGVEAGEINGLLTPEQLTLLRLTEDLEMENDHNRNF